MSDANGDGSVDYAYAVDTIGDIYRIDFSNATLVPAGESGSWSIRKVAYTTGGGRKFLYPPSLLRTSTKMYVALGRRPGAPPEHPLPYEDPIINRFYVLLDDLTIRPTTTAR